MNMLMRLRKTLSFACIAILFMFTLCSCQASPVSTSQQNGTAGEENLSELKIGIDTLKPFMYVDKNGSYTGIDADTATEACKRAGFKPVFIEIPWADRDTYLENGTVDCLWTAFAIDGREDAYLCTDPYVNSKEAFLVEDRSPSQSLEEFRGPGGVAVRANSKAEELMLSPGVLANDTSVHAYGTFDMAKTAFVKAYTDGLIGHRIVLSQVMDEYPGIYRFLDDNLATLHLGVAFPKEGSSSFDAINNALAGMKEDGSLAAIIANYDPDQTSLEVASDERH